MELSLVVVPQAGRWHRVLQFYRPGRYCSREGGAQCSRLLKRGQDAGPSRRKTRTGARTTDRLGLSEGLTLQYGGGLWVDRRAPSTMSSATAAWVVVLPDLAMSLRP